MRLRSTIVEVLPARSMTNSANPRMLISRSLPTLTMSVSVPALEAVLLMRRKPDQAWTAVEMAAELYMKPPQVRAVLLELSARGLCAVVEDAGEPAWAWRPATADLARLLGELADAYARYLVPVTNLIHSKPRASLRRFSDAFRLRDTE